MRVHPEILERQKLPDELVTKHIWKERFEDICAFERYATRNGIAIRKFFLNVSRDEQKERLLQPARPAGQELEVLGRRREGARPLGRLHAGVRGDDPAHRDAARAVVRRARRSQVVHAARGRGRGRRRAQEPQPGASRRSPKRSARSSPSHARCSRTRSDARDRIQLEVIWSGVSPISAREDAMADEDTPRPDFTKGFPLNNLPDGQIVSGKIGDDDAILVRRGDEIFAVGAHCTHYHGPLADGLIVGDTIRCPWHHACFSLRTGEALRAPALDPIACWRVERKGDTRLRPREAAGAGTRQPRASGSRAPASVVIVGGGAAGLAAADMLRRRGLRRPDHDDQRRRPPPVDRPNLSKDYLAGTAQGRLDSAARRPSSTRSSGSTCASARAYGARPRATARRPARERQDAPLRCAC